MDLPSLPQHIIRKEQLILVANQLENTYQYTPDLHRLCQLGGFVIRGIDIWWDSQSYNQELRKQVTNASFDRLKSIQSIHDYVWKFTHVNKYLHERLPH